MGTILPTFIIVIGLLSGSLADHTAEGCRIVLSVTTPEAAAAEGTSGTFRISRSCGEVDLSVTLRLSGDATFAADYELQGAADVDVTGATVLIPRDRESVDLTVPILDDVAAEAAESITLSVGAAANCNVAFDAREATLTIPRNDFVVTSTGDDGEGSLRQAILNANALPGSDTITFDTTVGPFETPQTIVLQSPLPELKTRLTIDGAIKGRLWRATGVTVSGNGRAGIFKVTREATVTLSNLTVANGRARRGGGIFNAGRLVVRNVTLMDNRASSSGGGLANRRGTLTVINSTFANNSARRAGGGLVNLDGTTTVTNCTFHGNAARKGSGLFSGDTLLLRNTILADGVGGNDCVVAGLLDPASTNNIIETQAGCGTPISTLNPGLVGPGLYNGPTPTLALKGGSPAINLGDNASAVDENGDPLRWDQRGNGDPRFVAGIVDVGAFEHQALAVLVVDTFEDTELRACTRAGAGDCSLRGAITLVNAAGRPEVIRFDSAVFSGPRTITLTRPLPQITTDTTIDAGGTPGVTVRAHDDSRVFKAAPGVRLELREVVEESATRTPHPG